MRLNLLPTCDLEAALFEEAQDALPPNFKKEKKAPQYDVICLLD